MILKISDHKIINMHVCVQGFFQGAGGSIHPLSFGLPPLGILSDSESIQQVF